LQNQSVTIANNLSQQEGRLHLPIKADIIEAILEYLYSDEVAGLAKSEDAEFISNLLVVADQFLLTRLKVPTRPPIQMVWLID
jgi:hypothetical protein